MTTTNPDRQANIVATERRYGALRHVPSGRTAAEVRTLDIRHYDPARDSAAVQQEVQKVLDGIRYVAALHADGSPPPVIYCPSQTVLEQARSRANPADLQRVLLTLGG